jgi:hypothetical protein
MLARFAPVIAPIAIGMVVSGSTHAQPLQETTVCAGTRDSMCNGVVNSCGTRGAMLNETFVWNTASNQATAAADYGAQGVLSVSALVSGGVGCERRGSTSARFQDTCTIVGGLGSGMVRYHFSFLSGTEGSIEIHHTNAGVLYAQTLTAANPTSMAFPFSYGTPFALWVELKVSVIEPPSAPPAARSQSIRLDSISIDGGDPCRLRMAGATCIQYHPRNTPPLGPVIYVDQNAPACGDGRTWATAVNDLHLGLNMAKVASNLLNPLDCPIRVWVKAGTYTPVPSNGSRDVSFSPPPNVKVYGSFAGTETDPSQRNIAANPTILSGEIGMPGITTDNSRHVVTVQGDGIFTLDGFTISGGYSDAEACSSCVGGAGIRSFATNGLVIRNCTLLNNQAPGGAGGANGGAIRLYEFDGVHHTPPALTAVSCVFEHNSASGGNGGAISFARTNGDSSSATNFWITDSVFRNNEVPGYGGAIYLDMGGSINGSMHLIERCVFDTNRATSGAPGVARGGAIMANTALRLRVTDTKFQSNSANHTLSGSAVRLMGAVGLAAEFVRCDFTRNTGSITIDTGSQMIRLESCVFDGNSTGGPAYIVACGGSVSKSVSNCVFTNNSSGGGFGSILYMSTGQVTTTTFWNNSGGPYAILNSGGSVSANNCIIWGSAANQVSNVSLSYSIQQGGTTANHNINSDPLFLAPTNPAGPDGLWRSHDDGLRLSGLSPGIDSGNNNLVYADWADLDGDGNASEAAPFDLAGAPRFRDDRFVPDAGVTGNGHLQVVDIGAYENQTGSCIADTDDGSGTGSPDGGVGIEDLLYYLTQYDAGNLRADVDDGTATGTRDGGVGIEDLLYYLTRFDAGC